MKVVIFYCSDCKVHFGVEPKEDEKHICCPYCEAIVIDEIGTGELLTDLL